MALAHHRPQQKARNRPESSLCLQACNILFKLGAIGRHAGLLKHNHVDLPRVYEQIAENTHAQQRLLLVVAFGHGKKGILAHIDPKTFRLQQFGNQPGAPLPALGIGRAALELEADEVLVPIISGKNGGHENGLHLKRITRLSFKEKESLTGVYVPDFVIKVEAKDEESYYIADAKFSSLSTVRRHYAKELAFKYLLTSRTTNPFAHIRGLYVYYGKRYEGSDEPVSAWDLLDPEHDVNEPSFILQGLFPERQ